MQILRMLCVSAFVLSAKNVAAQTGVKPDSAAVHAEIVALNRSMEQAFRDRDLKKLAATYADNAIIRSSRGVGAAGRMDIDAFFGGVPSPKALTVELYGLSIQGDVVYQTGKLTNVFGSPERSNVFQMMFVWKRGTDGKFRIVLQYYHEVERG